MRNELQVVAQQVEQTSRLEYLFRKSSIVAKVNKQLAQVEAEFIKQSENLTALEAQKMEIEGKLVEQASSLESAKRQLEKKSVEINKLEDKLETAKSDLRKAKNALGKNQEVHEILLGKHHKLKQSYQELREEFGREKIATKLREDMVSRLISAQNENKHLVEFRNILQNKFLQFATEESSLENEAGALLKLQEIEKELTMISGFPEFYSAYMVAVGGGFSAGKSEFISSFFSNKTLKLPSSIEPTTAIPTYVVNTSKESNHLIGINTQGGTVDLLEIDPELVQKLNHQFMQSFSFPLKNIMPYMFLTARLDYKHLCFVDTPGYNPTGSHTCQDMGIAYEFVENAEALIWLVGADANGTIPRSDIVFLKDVLSNRDKQVYFVLNKADLKPLSDVKAILAEFRRVLEVERISYVGISAYNAISGKELCFVQRSVSDFLVSINKSSNKQKQILQKLYEVEEAYQCAIKRDIKQHKVITNVLDDIAFDLNKNNFLKGEGEVYDQLDEVASYFDSKKKKYEKHLMLLKELMDDFTDAINNLFGAELKIKRPYIEIDSIEIDKLDFYIEKES